MLFEGSRIPLVWRRLAPTPAAGSLSQTETPPAPPPDRTPPVASRASQAALLGSGLGEQEADENPDGPVSSGHASQFISCAESVEP